MVKKMFGMKQMCNAHTGWCFAWNMQYNGLCKDCYKYLQRKDKRAKRQQQKKCKHTVNCNKCGKVVEV